VLISKTRKFRNIRFVGNLTLSTRCEFYFNDVTVTTLYMAALPLKVSRNEQRCYLFSVCSWTLPCASSLVPSVLHLSLGFQCSPTLNRQPYKGRLPLTSWWRKSSNMTVGTQPDILNQPLLRLTSRKPLWLDLQPVDIKSRWRHNWKSDQVVNSHLVCDPTIRQPGFDLLNRFRTEQGHCGACRKKWRLTWHWSVSL